MIKCPCIANISRIGLAGSLNRCFYMKIMTDLRTDFLKVRGYYAADVDAIIYRCKEIQNAGRAVERAGKRNDSGIAPMHPVAIFGAKAQDGRQVALIKVVEELNDLFRVGSLLLQTPVLGLGRNWTRHDDWILG